MVISLKIYKKKNTRFFKELMKLGVLQSKNKYNHMNQRKSLCKELYE